jgi:hypothetical protein
MQAPVEICYAGVVVSRAEEVREGAGGELFVVMKDPLPVGTLLGVRSADELITVRVAHVVETADGAESGMQVRPAASDDAGVARWIPPPPAAKTASTPPAAVPSAPAVAAPAVANEPAQAAPEPAVAPSASASPPVAEEPAPSPAVQLAFEAVEVFPPAAPAPFAKEEQPAASEAVPSESATRAVSNDSGAVPQAVPVTVASSLTGALKDAVGGESGEFSGAVESEPVKGDLPPAKPVQGASGRRRTKRRRSS